jgi:hypothetical protein
LFRDSDEEEEFSGFNGDLDEYDMDAVEDDECVALGSFIISTDSFDNV